MKKSILCVAALIVAAIVSVTVVSCKKDKDEVVTKATNSEAQALLNRIEAFQTLRDAVNSGTKTDGSMTVEEMRQALDLVSNYEHSEHMTYCLNTVLDTLHVAMPAINGEGYVSNADVVATYNAFETALEKCMLGVKDGMDVPSYFSIVMPKTGAKDDDDIDIVFLRGEADDAPGYEEHTSEGPFREGDDFVWGLGLGLCNPIGPFNSNTDAAKELTKQFKFRPDAQHQGQTCILENVEIVVYTPSDYNLPEGWIYYVDPNMEDCAPTWLFLYEGEIPSGSPEPCIPWYEMNCYWRSIRRNITLPNAPLNVGPSTHSPYHECSVIARLDYRQRRRMHVAEVVYCYVSWPEPILPPVD